MMPSQETVQEKNTFYENSARHNYVLDIDIYLSDKFSVMQLV